jgi:hypothetical protein
MQHDSVIHITEELSYDSISTGFILSTMAVRDGLGLQNERAVVLVDWRASHTSERMKAMSRRQHFHNDRCGAHHKLVSST